MRKQTGIGIMSPYLLLREGLGHGILLAAVTFESHKGEESVRLFVFWFAVGNEQMQVTAQSILCLSSGCNKAFQDPRADSRSMAQR
jgi:hypothetical protein